VNRRRLPEVTDLLDIFGLGKDPGVCRFGWTSPGF
jgi:hypothetical protein